MWQENNIYYSEKSILKLLKSASTEKLIEYLLMMTGRAKK
jgi:hypothetical protein